MANWGKLYGNLSEKLSVKHVNITENKIILVTPYGEGKMKFSDYLFMADYEQYQLAYEYVIPEPESEKLTNYSNDITREDSWEKGNQNDLYCKYNNQLKGIRYCYFPLYLTSNYNSRIGKGGKWFNLLDIGYVLGVNAMKLPESNHEIEARIALKNSSLKLKKKNIEQKAIDELIRFEINLYNQIYEQFNLKDDSEKGLYFDLEKRTYYDFLSLINEFEDIKLFRLDKTLKPHWKDIYHNQSIDIFKPIDNNIEHFQIVYENTNHVPKAFTESTHMTLINYEAWVEKEKHFHETKLVKINKLIWFPTVFINFY